MPAFQERASDSQNTVSFLSIIPLEKLFDFGGEQMALYTGKDLGDLISVTLNKCVPPFFFVEKLVLRACLTLFSAVEATLAIILLLKCE